MARLTDGPAPSGRSLGRSNEIIAVSTPPRRHGESAVRWLRLRGLRQGPRLGPALAEQMGDAHLIRPIGPRRVVLPAATGWNRSLMRATGRPIARLLQPRRNRAISPATQRLRTSRTGFRAFRPVAPSPRWIYDRADAGGRVTRLEFFPMIEEARKSTQYWLVWFWKICNFEKCKTVTKTLLYDDQSL